LEKIWSSTVIGIDKSSLKFEIEKTPYYEIGRKESGEAR